MSIKKEVKKRFSLGEGKAYGHLLVVWRPVFLLMYRIGPPMTSLSGGTRP
jgi:hypothetical protein